MQPRNLFLIIFLIFLNSCDSSSSSNSSELLDNQTIINNHKSTTEQDIIKPSKTHDPDSQTMELKHKEISNFIKEKYLSTWCGNGMVIDPINETTYEYEEPQSSSERISDVKKLFDKNYKGKYICISGTILDSLFGTYGIGSGKTSLATEFFLIKRITKCIIAPYSMIIL